MCLRVRKKSDLVQLKITKIIHARVAGWFWPFIIQTKSTFAFNRHSDVTIKTVTRSDTRQWNKNNIIKDHVIGNFKKHKI